MADEVAPEERRFGWSNMFLDPDEDPRSQEDFHGERETLVGYLAFQRQTLELKCSGLDPEQLACRSVPPSNLSLLGLIRHMAGVEQAWLRLRMAGEEGARHYCSDGDDDGDFNGAVPASEVVVDAFDRWRAEMAFADDFIAQAPDLEVVGKEGHVLRDVLVHMIEEYARHLGHADFLRERIDGRIGQ